MADAAAAWVAYEGVAERWHVKYIYEIIEVICRAWCSTVVLIIIDLLDGRT